MDHAQCCKAAAALRKFIVEDYGFLDTSPKQDCHGVVPGHLVWMCDQIPSLSENKAMRWLGYIQGVLVATGRVTLEQMKDLSREAVTPEEPYV